MVVLDLGIRAKEDGIMVALQSLEDQMLYRDILMKTTYGKILATGEKFKTISSAADRLRQSVLEYVWKCGTDRESMDESPKILENKTKLATILADLHDNMDEETATQRANMYYGKVADLYSKIAHSVDLYIESMSTLEIKK